MSLTFKPTVDIFSEIVATLRIPGVITNISEASGVSTITGVNTLRFGDVVTIDTVDYKVYDVSSSEFKVKATGLVGNAWTPKAPYYKYGHMLEIVNELAMKDRAVNTLKYQKYPLIILAQDFPERFSKVSRYMYDTELTLYIVDITRQERNAEQRYDNVFKPYLLPLYEDFIQAMLNSDYIGERFIEHVKWDRLYWGRELPNYNEKTVGTDFLDAIELADVNIKITNKC